MVYIKNNVSWPHLYVDVMIIACDIPTSPKELHVPASTHTHTIVLWLFWILSETQVSWYQKGKTRKVKPIWIYWSKSGSGLCWAIY